LFYLWLAQYLSRIQNTWDTWKHAPNAIGRSTHIPLSQVQDDLPCLHFHKYNRILRQDGTNSCSRFIIILISYLFIPLFKYIQKSIINCILLWILYIGLNVRLHKKLRHLKQNTEQNCKHKLAERTLTEHENEKCMVTGISPHKIITQAV